MTMMKKCHLHAHFELITKKKLILFTVQHVLNVVIISLCVISNSYLLVLEFYYIAQVTKDFPVNFIHLGYKMSIVYMHLYV